VVGDKREILGVGDQAVCERKRQNQRTMARTFVVVGKAVAIVTDLNYRFVELDELQRADIPRDESVFSRIDLARRAVAWRRLGFAKNREERVLRENVFDIGDEQLLMLLFVMNSERKDRFDLTKQSLVGTGNKSVDVRINGSAIFFRFVHRRTRDESAQVASMHRAGGVVIGVKKIGVLGNCISIARHPFFQNEGLEKPGGVRKMPFRRAYFRHRLYNAIFGSEAFGYPGSEISNLVKAREKLFSWRRLRPRTLLRGRFSICCGDRGLDQVIPPSCSSSSLRASSI